MLSWKAKTIGNCFLYLLYTDLHADGLIRHELNTLGDPYWYYIKSNKTNYYKTEKSKYFVNLRFSLAHPTSFVRNVTTILELYNYLRLKLFWRPCSSEKLPNLNVILVFISGQVLQNTPSFLVKCDSQHTADVIPYNNRNDGGPAARLVSLVEVPEKAIHG